MTTKATEMFEQTMWRQIADAREAGRDYLEVDLQVLEYLMMMTEELTRFLSKT